MEGIAEADEEETSSSSEEIILEEEIFEEEEVIVEEEIDGELLDSSSVYDEEEIVEEEITIEDESTVVEEEEVVEEVPSATSDEEIVVGKIPPNADIDTDDWNLHFQKQQEHVFEDSETLLDFYNEATLATVYDMTSWVEKESVSSLSQPGVETSLPQDSTESNNNNNEEQESDNIMKRLAKKRQMEQKLQAKEDDNNIMKRLAKNVQVKQRKEYRWRRNKPREDPYMQELQETVSIWFRIEVEDHKASQGGEENQESLLQDSIPTNRFSGGVESMEAGGISAPNESTSSNQWDDVVFEREMAQDKDATTRETEIGNCRKDHVEHEVDVHRGKPEEDEVTSAVIDDIVPSSDSKDTRSGEQTDIAKDLEGSSAVPSSPKGGIDNLKSFSEAGIETIQKEAHTVLTGVNPSNERLVSLKSEARDGKGDKLETLVARKMEDTVSTSTNSSEDDSADDDDSSDSSMNYPRAKRKAPNRGISMDDAENQELVNKVLEESQETAVDLEEIMSAIPTVLQSMASAGPEQAAIALEPQERASAYQRTYGSSEKSALLDFIQKRDWKGLESCMAFLKEADPFSIQQELTRELVLHHALLHAPGETMALLISLIPFKYREDVLMAVDDSGRTPLHIACEHFTAPNGRTVEAQNIKILTLGANRVHSMHNYAGETPLSLLLASSGVKALQGSASEEVASDLVQTILKETLDLVHERIGDSTLLHIATANNVHDGVLRALLEADGGAPLSRIRDQHGMLPLHNLVSCTNGIIPAAKSAKRLIKAYPESIAVASTTGDTPLHLFVSNVTSWIVDKDKISSPNTSKLLQSLLGTGSGQSPLLTRNDDGMFPLHCCVKFKTPAGPMSIMKKDPTFTAATTQRDRNGATPFHIVCASPSCDDMIPVINIVGTQEAALVQDNDRNTPLLVAIGNPSITERVIAAIGTLNPSAARIENAKGRTPFHVAIRSKLRESIIREVIKVDPKAVKKVVFKGNNNIFHEMCQHKTSKGILTGLLNVHPDGAKGQNDKGNLPLHVAAAYHLSSKIINSLIQAYPEGCLVKNKSKEIPLHYAVGDEDAKEKNVFALLKASPGSILVRDKKGRTPMDLAKDTEVSVEVYEVLRKYYKEQTKGDEPSEARKHADKKKKKKTKSDFEGSMSLANVHTSPGILKRQKKKEDVGLYDLAAIFDDSLQGSMNLNSDVKANFDGSSSLLQNNSPSKEKKNRKYKEETKSGKSFTRSHPVDNKRSSNSKQRLDGAETESRKSRRKLPEDGDHSKSHDTSKRKSKSNNKSEGASLFTTPKTRKSKVADEGTPKIRKASSMINLSTYAVKTPKLSKTPKLLKSSRRSERILSVNGSEDKIKRSKTPKVKKASSMMDLIKTPKLQNTPKSSKSGRSSKRIHSATDSEDKTKRSKTPKVSSKTEKKKRSSKVDKIVQVPIL